MRNVLWEVIVPFGAIDTRPGTLNLRGGFRVLSRRWSSIIDEFICFKNKRSQISTIPGMAGFFISRGPEIGPNSTGKTQIAISTHIWIELQCQKKSTIASKISCRSVCQYVSHRTHSLSPLKQSLRTTRHREN